MRIPLAWQCLLAVAAATLQEEEDVLRIGVVQSFTGAGAHTSLTALTAVILADLDLGKQRVPPTKLFVEGCYLVNCSAGEDSVVIPPALRVQNPHPDLLKLRVHLIDDRWDMRYGSRGAIDFIYGAPEKGVPRVNAIMGAFEDEITMAMSTISSVLDMVQVTNLATTDLLTDKSKHPYLFRVTSANGVTGHVMVDYVRLYGWRGACLLYQDTEYGNDVRTGMIAAADQHQRSDDLAFFAIDGIGVGGQEGRRLVTQSVRIAAQQIVMTDHRLVLFALRSEYDYGAAARGILLEEGVVSPKYQFFSTLFTTAVAQSNEAMAGHQYWHGIAPQRDWGSSSVTTYIQTWQHLIPDDITSAFARYGMDHWEVGPDLRALTKQFFDFPLYLPMVLDILASMYVLYSAFNDMLWEGFRPLEIRGARLREYVKNITFQGLGMEYRFNADQDVVAPVRLQYFDSSSNDTARWVTFATRQAINGGMDGEILPEAGLPQGPKWAVGEHGQMPPVALTGCSLGQQLVRLGTTDFGRCEKCPAGTFSESHNASECILCPGGHFSPGESSGCKPCMQGTFALPGSRECLPCFAGSFASETGLTACTACLPGMYQNESGQARCGDCKAGSVSQASAMECTLCEPGHYAVEVRQTLCEPCSPGMYQQNFGESACQPCGAGSFTNERGQPECEECRPGTFQPNQSSSEGCHRCAAGRYSEGYGAVVCEACPYGTTQVLGADDRALCGCPPGSFLYVHDQGQNSSKEKQWKEKQECLLCNRYMEACEGGLAPARQRQGYYISMNGQDVYQCASNDACPGGNLAECPEGSSGLGCAECRKGSYYWDGEKCSTCVLKNGFFVAFLPVSIAVLFIGTHWFGNDPIGQSLSAVSEFIVLAGLSLSVLMFMSALAAVDVDWKEPVKSLVDLSSQLSSRLTNLSFTCSLDMNVASGQAIVSVIPLLVAGLCMLAARISPISGKLLFNTYGTLTYAAYLLLVLHGLKPFRYIVHPAGSKSLLFMPSVFEGSDDHKAVMAVGVLVVLIYCVPFAAACIYASYALVASKSSVRRHWFLTTFRFLFYKFHPYAPYWAVCILVRNTAFALGPSIFPDRPLLSIFMLAAVAVSSAVHTAFVQPWRTRWMNYVDVGILIYMSLLLTLSTAWLKEDDDSDSILATAMAVFAFIAVSFAIIFGAQLLLRIACAGKAGREQMREKLQHEREAFEQEMMEIYADPKQEVADALDTLTASPRRLHPSHSSNLTVDLPAPLCWVAQQTTQIDQVVAIASQIRDKNYTLQCFYEDCLSAFPELELYAFQDEGSFAAMQRNSKLQASQEATQAHQGSKASDKRRPGVVADSSSPGYLELQRTLGALFAIYWLCRVDMDGRQGMSFGVSETNPHECQELPTNITPEDLKELTWGNMSPEQRRMHFYLNFDWALMVELLHQAGVTKDVSDGGGSISLDTRPEGRLVALLCLTAFHDIMKNQGLCPRVQGTPYEGFKVGDCILDHDLALAYLLDRHPEVLPSFRALSEDQQRVVRFTQSEMGFNAGWLVQAEGPPSAVLTKLKNAIEAGSALDEDVAFYFAHWVTDLAGAEPTPFRGNCKFAVKFPPHVLRSLLECFGIVKELANMAETEVYEQYLIKRWTQSSAGLGPVPKGLYRTAKLRLHCMAQQSAVEIIHAFDAIPEEDRWTLCRELSETGLEDQHFSEWEVVNGPQLGVPFLLYYGPAWCQRVGESHPELCLQVLARTFRRARVAFDDKQIASIKTGHRTAYCGLLKSIDLDGLKAASIARGENCLEIIPESDLEGKLSIQLLDA